MTEDDRSLKQGFSEKKVPENLDVIVLGSGMGGMTVASLLAQAGKRVLMLEQHDVLGGNTHTFVDQGFEFDTGLHYIGGEMTNKTKPMRKVFDMITKGQVEWTEMDEVFDKCVVGDDTVEIHAGFKNMVAGLKERFNTPADHAAIDKHFKLVRKVTANYTPAHFMTRLLGLPAFLRKMITGATNVMSTKGIQFRTAKEVIEDLTSNKELQGALLYNFGDYGESPDRGTFFSHCILWAHYIKGASYPVGGPATIAKAVVKVIEEFGGKAFVRAKVTELIMDTSGKKVRGVVVSKGSKDVEVRAPIVISTIGAPNTFQKLVPKASRHLVEKHINFCKREDVRSDCSLMTLYLGLDGGDNPDSLKNLPRGNTWVFPSWDHVKNMNDFKQDPDSPLPGAFISFPSAKDPTYQERLGGKSIAVICAPCFFEHVEDFQEERVKHRSVAYQQLKKQWEEDLTNIFKEQYPELKDKIVFSEMSTAVTNDYYLGTHRGAIYGLGHTKARVQDDEGVLSVRTPIDGLLLGGQDVFHCGVMAALTGSIFTVCEVLGAKSKMKYAKIFGGF